MKNKIKKNLLCLTAVALASSALPAQTGCISSKSINPDPPHVSTEQMEIISNSRFLPWNSPDGGKAYFNAWNGLENGKDFQYFLEECHEKIENEKAYKKSEFKYGEFSRTVYFPDEIDVEKSEGKLEHGVLKIHAPKKYAEKEAKKKLTVK